MAAHVTVAHIVQTFKKAESSVLPLTVMDRQQKRLGSVL